MEESSDKKQTFRWANTRMDEDQYRQAEEVAERLFEGNVSMLVRTAVKEFIQSQQIKQEAIAS